MFNFRIVFEGKKFNHLFGCWTNVRITEFASTVEALNFSVRHYGHSSYDGKLTIESIG
jgi:hypothetical protein